MPKSVTPWRVAAQDSSPSPVEADLATLGEWSKVSALAGLDSGFLLGVCCLELIL